MIVWSGRGGLSIAVLIVVLFSCILIFPKDQSDYGFVIAFSIAGIFSWVFGNKWNGQNERTVIDEKTGQRYILKNNHTLFWIKMQYWGIIFCLIGIIILGQISILAMIISLLIISLIVAIIYFRSKKEKNEIDDTKATKTISNKSKPTTFANPVPVENEEERLKLRQEKEDPNRFMPK
jgi:hypothetical protein